jgi:shikimate dehydrogenase
MSDPAPAEPGRIFILGDPVEHSLSPVFQNAALEELGLPWRYERRRVAPGELEAAIEKLRRPGVVGANITVPHKLGALQEMDALDQEASITGAVNTITVRDGQLRGSNTDVDGFMQALAGCQPDTLPLPGALLLGAGGAARAVAWGLSRDERVETLLVVSRNSEKGQTLINAVRDGLGRRGKPSPRFSLCSTPEEVSTGLREAIGLVVNATPLGMGSQRDQSPLPNMEGIPAEALIFDLTYGPGPNRLIEQAIAAGYQWSDGREMLLYQGARALQLWTGMEPPIEVMRDALLAALADPAKTRGVA